VVALLEALIREKTPDAVLFSATQAGKDYAPRLAQRLGGGCVTDAMTLSAEGNALLATRPAYGGTVYEQMKVIGPVKFATVRSGCFVRPEAGEPNPVETVPLSAPGGAVKAKVVETVTEITEAIDLEGAEVIVAGGLGMGSAEGFHLVEELAALLGGVVGASRPAIEGGWVSRAHQIGQSGKTVAPRLYIACGISGAMQHISGAMGSKYIVAVNKDPDASIFKVADVGIVGDALTILPLMMDEIRARKGL
jgi:electron transfer flavoprotein alpha subunit